MHKTDPTTENDMTQSINSAKVEKPSLAQWAQSCRRARFREIKWHSRTLKWAFFFPVHQEDIIKLFRSLVLKFLGLQRQEEQWWYGLPWGTGKGLGEQREHRIQSRSGVLPHVTMLAWLVSSISDILRCSPSPQFLVNMTDKEGQPDSQRLVQGMLLVEHRSSWSGGGGSTGVGKR